MNWLRKLVFVVMGLSLPAAAQFTQVTGTVTDPNGLPYANGTISATLVISGSPTLNGLTYTPPSQPTGLNGAGSFLMRLADNTVLLPGGSQWKFTVCSGIGTVQPSFGKGSVCFTAGPITISGSSQVITSTLTAAALPLTVPFGGSGFITGGGASPQIALWNGATSITGLPDFTYSDSSQAQFLLGSTGSQSGMVTVRNSAGGNTNVAIPQTATGDSSWFTPLGGSLSIGTGSGGGNVGLTAGAAIAGESIASISRSGGVVTTTYNVTSVTYPVVFGVGMRVKVVGVTDSSYNGTFQLTSASFTPSTGTLTWNQTGASTSSSGGTIELPQALSLSVTNAPGGQNLQVVAGGQGSAFPDGHFEPAIQLTVLGTATNGTTGGDIALNAGSSADAGSDATEPAGNISLYGGNAYGGNNNGGNVTLTPGVASGTGTAGTIKLNGPITTLITGSTQCLQANSTGVISGTGSTCGGGGSLPSGSQGNPIVNSSTGSGTTYSATPNEIHSSGFTGGTDLATILATAAASPTPIYVVLDPANTVMNVSNSGAAVTIGSATQPINVINRGQALNCNGTTLADCIDISQWGSLVCDAKGPGASSRGCFIGSSATAKVTSLVTNSDHTGAQSQMKFTGHNLQPSATSIVTHAAFWPVSVEGQGIFENLGVGCGGAGKVGVSIEDGPSSGDSNTDTFRSLNAFGSNFNGCIPLQVYATSTGSGSGQNILFDGGGAGDAVLAPVSLSTTAAVTVTGSPSTITVNNTTNLATNEQAFVSDGASSEYVIITSFAAATSITATFANTHSSGVTISTGLCWDSNGCMINIDGAAGGSGAQSVRNVHFNNFYAEGVTGAVSTANFVAIRNCQGCGFENFGFNGGPSVASAFKIGFSSVSTSAGFVTITASQHGARFTNWINNTIDSYTLAAAGGDNVTYTYPGPPTKTSGVISDGAQSVNGNLTINVTGSTQCLQANSSGVVSGTGAVCGGSGSSPGAPVNSVQYNSAGSFAGNTNFKFLNSIYGGTIPGLSLRDDGLSPSFQLDVESAPTLSAAPTTQGNFSYTPTTTGTGTFDVRQVNILGTFSGTQGSGGNTWAGLYDQISESVTSGTLTHGFASVFRTTFGHSAGAVCSLCATIYDDMTMSSMNGTIGSAVGFNITGQPWTGTGTVTEYDGINVAGPTSLGSLTLSFQTGATLPDATTAVGGTVAGLVIGGGFTGVTAGTKWGIYEGVTTPTSLINGLQGKVGINSATFSAPSGTLDVTAVAGAAALRFTGESTGTSNIFTGLDGLHGNGVFQLDGGGHLGSHNLSVSISGTGCTIGGNSNDEIGYLTLSAGATTCTVTFSGTTWSASAQPVCMVTPGASGQLPYVPALPTTTSFQITSAVASGNIYWHCFWEK